MFPNSAVRNVVENIPLSVNDLKGAKKARISETGRSAHLTDEGSKEFKGIKVSTHGRRGQKAQRVQSWRTHLASVSSDASSVRNGSKGAKSAKGAKNCNAGRIVLMRPL